ncbi:helicase associated domain-containing protein [Mycena capillaripes]|nr:helicase associated domain-containing protein [Mycena capillaripes]
MLNENISATDIPPAALLGQHSSYNRAFIATNGSYDISKRSVEIIPLDSINYSPAVRAKIFQDVAKILELLGVTNAKLSDKPDQLLTLYLDDPVLGSLYNERQTLHALSVSLTHDTIDKAGDLIRFDWVDAPHPEALMRALELLNYLGAIDDDGNLTPLGGIMAEFPLDPQAINSVLTKTFIVSPEFKCSNENLTITAMMSVPDVWIRPSNQRREADAAKARSSIPEGDHLTMLNQYMKNRHDKNWTFTHYLSARTLAQAETIRTHLERTMERHELGLALVSGFFMQAAYKKGKGNYLIVKDGQTMFLPDVLLHPSCSLATQPEWVIFNEFILTTRPYMDRD